MTDVPEPLVTAEEVAQLLGVSKDWVLDMWEAGKLPGFRLGGGRRQGRRGGPIRFRWSEIEATLEAWRDGAPVHRRGEHLEAVR